MMRPVKDIINNLQDSLCVSLRILAEIPNQKVFGVDEIRHNLRVNIRYISKLEDVYICNDCNEEFGDKPKVNYYKTFLHNECYEKRFGKEALEETIKAQTEWKELRKLRAEENASK